MARVVRITLLENCLDSSTVKELHVDQPLDQELMERMARHSKLLFYPHFPRPYFRIEREGYYVIQGVLGNRVVRITFSPAAGEEVECELKQLIES